MMEVKKSRDALIGESNVMSPLQGHHETEGEGAATNVSQPGLDAGVALDLGQLRPSALISVAKEPSPTAGNPRSNCEAEPVEKAEDRQTDDHSARVDEVGAEVPSKMLLVANDLDSETGEVASELNCDLPDAVVVGPASHPETVMPSKDPHEEISTSQGSEEADEILESASVSDSAHGSAESVADRSKDAAAVPWRAQYFTGTLAMRMGQAAKAPALFSLSSTYATDRSNPYDGEQTANQEAERVASVDNVSVLDFEALKVKSSPVNRDDFLATSRKRASVALIRPAQAAALMAALAAVFIAGVLAGFVARGDSETEAQKRVLEETAAGLKAEEERLLAREAEAQKNAEEFKRLVDEAEATRRAEAQRKAGMEASGAAPAPGASIAWPPDPTKPEAIAPSIVPTVELKSTELRPKRKSKAGAKKQNPQSQSVDDN